MLYYLVYVFDEIIIYIEFQYLDNKCLQVQISLFLYYRIQIEKY
jgi:hypothetical protein